MRIFVIVNAGHINIGWTYYDIEYSLVFKQRQILIN